MTGLDQADVVFNVVWTGTVFSALRDLTDSVLAHDRVRMRFVANACPPSEIAALETYAAERPDRIVDVRVASTDRMLRHGDCLDQVLDAVDDGPLFALLDPDILATGPFVDRFLAVLDDHVAVTSGQELWSEDNVRPDGHIGVNGEIFFDRDGYVFGSPHLALYRADALRATIDRWGVGFSSAGNDLRPDTRERLKAVGRDFWIYDTGKVVNILLQADGGALAHEEHPALVHVGGLAHFLAPPQPVADDQGVVRREWGQTDDWGEWEGQGDRFFVAGHAARLLRARAQGEPRPPIPDDVTDSMRGRLERLRTAVATLDDVPAR